jgi:hypothetical protein
LTKRGLPVVRPGPFGEGKATLERMRQRLGGPRDETVDTRPHEGGVSSYQGQIVLVLHEDVPRGRVDLWLGESKAVRAATDELSPPPPDVPTELQRLASDLRIFLALVPDSRVTFLTGAGVLRQGKLIERCRFGGLVALDDGTVLGVGFARFLGPSGAPGASPAKPPASPASA